MVQLDLTPDQRDSRSPLGSRGRSAPFHFQDAFEFPVEIFTSREDRRIGKRWLFAMPFRQSAEPAAPRCSADQ